MSMLLMVQAMKLDVGNPNRKLVLIKLADNANDKGFCFPSYKHIADHCNMSRRTAIRHIEDLAKMGLIKIEKRKTEKGNSSNIYYLNLTQKTEQKSNEKAVKNDDLPSDKLSPPLVTESHHPSDNVTPPSDRLSPPPSDTVSPITSHSFEPVNEPVSEPERRARALTPIGDDFKPSDTTIFHLKKNKLEPLDEIELETFINHYQGTGQFKANWDSVYKNWVIRERRNMLGQKKSSGSVLKEAGEAFING